jgi:hypothetical protein
MMIFLKSLGITGAMILAILTVLIAAFLFSDMPMKPEVWSREKEVPIADKVDIFACVKTAFDNAPQLGVSQLTHEKGWRAVTFELRSGDATGVIHGSVFDLHGYARVRLAAPGKPPPDVVLNKVLTTLDEIVNRVSISCSQKSSARSASPMPV